MIKISPSLLAADFSRLSQEAEKMQAAGADMLHVDVMDGHFVPNLTIGPPVIRALHACTGLKLDVHLMVDNPAQMLDAVLDAGADTVTVHLESCGDPLALIEKIRSRGAHPSLAIRPKTPVQSLFGYLDRVDMVLAMTVEPGFGGQKLLKSSLAKVSAIKKECLRLGLDTDIEVDGGITFENAGETAAAGANVFVSGSAIFRSADPSLAVRTLRRNAQRAVEITENNA